MAGNFVYDFQGWMEDVARRVELLERRRLGRGGGGGGVVVKGSGPWSAISALVDQSPGDMWILTEATGAPPSPYGPAAVGDAVVWAGSAWQNVGPIRGPAGPQGPPGDDGPVGPKGDRGDQGPPLERLDDIGDVDAPASTAAGMLLGTTAVGTWGPVDAPNDVPMDPKALVSEWSPSRTYAEGNVVWTEDASGNRYYFSSDVTQTGGTAPSLTNLATWTYISGRGLLLEATLIPASVSNVAGSSGVVMMWQAMAFPKGAIVRYRYQGFTRYWVATRQTTASEVPGGAAGSPWQEASLLANTLALEERSPTRISRPNGTDRLVEVWDGAAWVPTHYDSGWRDVSALLINGHTGVIHCRRLGRTVRWRTYFAGIDASAATSNVFMDPSQLTPGFRHDYLFGSERAVIWALSNQDTGSGYLYSTTWELPRKNTAAPWWSLPAGTSWDIDETEPIPTALPGTTVTIAP